MSKSLTELANAAHEMSVSKGWYENSRTPLEFHMLIVSEIAEASEEIRNKSPQLYIKTSLGVVVEPLDIGYNKFVDDIKRGYFKPEGEGIELADAVIRIMDYAIHRGIDLEQMVKLKMAYNATRPHRHGGKAL